MTNSRTSRPQREEIGRRVPNGAVRHGEFTYSVVESVRPSRGGVDRGDGDRRGEGRTPSHLREGSIAAPTGRVLADCRIRDLSKRGARLELSRERPLPRAFVLIEGGTRRSFQAVLMWQAGRNAGVRLREIA